MRNQFKDISELQRELQVNPDLQKQFQENPAEAINKIEFTSPLEKDEWVYRIIVIALGLTIFTIVVGVLVLIGFGEISDDKSVPTILTAIGSAAIGAMAGLLVPAPRKQ